MEGPDGLPDPALVVLVGAAGSGKSHWAAARYRSVEVVSSDALRAVVGSGPADLDASDDAFRLLDQVVSARVGRRLTTVVDTLGLDAGRRLALQGLAREHGLAAVVVVLDTPVRLCRERDDVAVRVERLRGRATAARFAEQHHAGTAAAQADRYLRLADQGVGTVFVALADLDGPEDVERLVRVVEALR